MPGIGSYPNLSAFKIGIAWKLCRRMADKVSVIMGNRKRNRKRKRKRSRKRKRKRKRDRKRKRNPVRGPGAGTRQTAVDAEG